MYFSRTTLLAISLLGLSSYGNVPIPVSALKESVRRRVLTNEDQQTDFMMDKAHDDDSIHRKLDHKNGGSCIPHQYCRIETSVGKLEENGGKIFFDVENPPFAYHKYNKHPVITVYAKGDLEGKKEVYQVKKDSQPRLMAKLFNDKNECPDGDQYCSDSFKVERDEYNGLILNDGTLRFILDADHKVDVEANKKNEAFIVINTCPDECKFFTQSGKQGIYKNDDKDKFKFKNLPYAKGKDVELTVYLRGNFGEPNEYVEIKGEDGMTLKLEQVNKDCDEKYKKTKIKIDAGTFNRWIDTGSRFNGVVFKLDYSDEVDRNCGVGFREKNYLTLEYDGIGSDCDNLSFYDIDTEPAYKSIYNYDDAKAFCELFDKRLCTEEEIIDSNKVDCEPKKCGSNDESWMPLHDSMHYLHVDHDCHAQTTTSCYTTRDVDLTPPGWLDSNEPLSFRKQICCANLGVGDQDEVVTISATDEVDEVVTISATDEVDEVVNDNFDNAGNV